MYYAYAFFPVYFWRDVLLRRDVLIMALQGGLRSNGGTVSIVLMVVSILAGLEALVSKRYGETKDTNPTDLRPFTRCTVTSNVKLYR